MTKLLDIRSSNKNRSLNSQSWLRTQGPIYLAFILIAIFFTLKAPNFATLATLANIGREVAVVTIVSVGMTLVIITAEIDLSVGSTVTFTGMIAAILMHQGVNWVLASFAAMAVGAGIGAINGAITAYVGVPSFLVTLGMMEVFGGASEILTGSLSVPISSNLFGNVFGDNPLLRIPADVWWTIIIVIIGYFLLHKSLLGRWIYATGGNVTAARFSGISVRKIKLTTFVITGILCALGGLILAARFGAGNPIVGNGMELDAIAATILGGTNLFGGRGIMIGTVFGAVFIEMVGVGLVMMGAGAELQTLIKGAIIVAAVAVNKIGERRNS